MQSVELKGLEQIDRLCKRLERSPEAFAKARRECFESAAQEAKAIVDRQIGGSGKVQRWQESTVGTRGGDARVAPKKETWTERTKKAGNRYAVGAVTNAIVSGHRLPSPSGRRYYKPRIRSGGMKVPGRPFYDQAGPQIQDLARRTAERVVERYLKEMEG